MNYKQKYKEALERARELSKTVTGANYEYIFPELKESEDERIRKEIIRILKGETSYVSKEDTDKYVAWLEKQVEKKPYEWHSEDEQNLNAVLAFIEDEYLRRWLKDIIHAKYEQCVNDNMKEQKVESRFRVGDCVISNDGTHTYIVKERRRGTYVILDIGENKEFCIDIETADRTGRLWTIQDAKDGDVLVASDESIFIYAGSTDRYAKFYVALTNYGTFNFDGGNWEDKNSVHPSTKKQRDLLFHKMAEEGYEWDAEKKELKKMEVANKEIDDAYLQGICDAKHEIEKQGKTLDADEVIEWLDNQACLGYIEDIEVEKFVEQFKKDFGL